MTGEAPIDDLGEGPAFLKTEPIAIGDIPLVMSNLLLYTDPVGALIYPSPVGVIASGPPCLKDYSAKVSSYSASKNPISAISAGISSVSSYYK